mmetsp:Transcript_61695/g.113634  ORF Transcript_61695/g.113634 Transcript_61695/m.113634 type:complete len:84 (-) Transcript_61695:1883-2134(-)
MSCLPPTHTTQSFDSNAGGQAISSVPSMSTPDDPRITANPCCGTPVIIATCTLNFELEYGVKGAMEYASPVLLLGAGNINPGS